MALVLSLPPWGHVKALLERDFSLSGTTACTSGSLSLRDGAVVTINGTATVANSTVSLLNGDEDDPDQLVQGEGGVVDTSQDFSVAAYLSLTGSTWKPVRFHRCQTRWCGHQLRL
jgi:hypothetical protein